MEGFTYNGIHSSKFNCWYIPNADDRWFASPEFELYEKEVPGHPGGYSYGDRTKIRTFSLKVFFEDIDRQTREKIRWWLDQKTMGELEFDERPFVVYRCVRPKKTVLGKIYTGQYGDSQELYSGTFTVEFSCYEPYGYLKYKTYDTYDKDGAGMYCGMLEQSEMPAAPAVTDRSFLIYNPGTEVCDTLIRIGGTTGAGGLTIKNITNETQCKLSSLPQNGYLEIGSGAGSVIHVNGNTRTLDFQYHDSGYLT